MKMANKLELTWVGKENEIKVEPRILIENPALSNISHKTSGQASIFDTENAGNFDNMLIHGDNLLALKALKVNLLDKLSASISIRRTILMPQMNIMMIL